ncbi:MAG: NAD(P)-dependent oxidoreductase [bacterium]|nr:NAD(P)-dependent oxidoreductase [bacterium]
MRILVTGSSGHLGEGLVRRLHGSEHEVVGLDRLASPFTEFVGRLEDASFVRHAMRGVDYVIHSATLHKPHVATHSKQDFVDTNITGTLNVLEAAVEAGVSRLVFTSTTSAFGSALVPGCGEPASWITECVRGAPKNIYGVTKLAAEDLCQLFWKTRGLPCIVLRTSRFFPEADDKRSRREAFDDMNLKVNELLYRRLDLEDAVQAHLRAIERVVEIGFGRYIVSATTPFEPRHLVRLRSDAPGVVLELFPDYEQEFVRHGWKMLPGIDRVYDNSKARKELAWTPRLDFGVALEGLRRDEGVFSPLSRTVGEKGYHERQFEDGPYPVE